MARPWRDPVARAQRDSARPEEAPREAPLLRRVGWMALIWAGSVAALGVVSLILRWWLK
jgi:hypothetical protein